MLKKKYILLLAIFLLNLIIKAIYWNQNPVLSRDSCLYLRLIEIWAERDNFQDVLVFWDRFWIPPLHLYLIKTISKFTFDNLISGLGLNIFVGSLIPLLVYYISKEISHNIKLSILSSLLTSFHPVINELSVQIQRDIIYLFLSGFIIYYTILYLKSYRSKDLLFLGLFNALNLLSRFEAIEFIVTIPFLFIILLIKKKITAQRAFYGMLIYLASIFVSIVFLYLYMDLDIPLWKIYSDHLHSHFHDLLNSYNYN